MPSFKNSEFASTQIVIESFRQEALDILNEIEKYHQSAQKQINFVFQKILDNIPKEIMHMPYQKCKEQYLKQLGKSAPTMYKQLSAGKIESNEENIDEEEEEEEEEGDDDDQDKDDNEENEQNDDENKENRQSKPAKTEHKVNKNETINEDDEGRDQFNVNDETNIIEFGSGLDKNLTSTVKRPIQLKNLTKASKESLKNGQNNKTVSIIDETTSLDLTNNEIDTEKLHEINTDSPITITYLLKNGSKKTISLNKLDEIEFNNVASECVQDLRKIFNLFNKK